MAEREVKEKKIYITLPSVKLQTAQTHMGAQRSGEEEEKVCRTGMLQRLSILLQLLLFCAESRGELMAPGL